MFFGDTIIEEKCQSFKIKCYYKSNEKLEDKHRLETT